MAGENSEADGAGAQAQAGDSGVGSESQRCLEATVTDEITCALRAMKGENESQRRLEATVIWLADQLRRMTFKADGFQARAERAEAKLAAAPAANDIGMGVLQEIANKRFYHINELMTENDELKKRIQNLQSQSARLEVDHANVHSWWTASQNRVGDLQRHRDELIKEIEELQENGRERDKQNRKLANALKRAMKGKRVPVKRKTAR